MITSRTVNNKSSSSSKIPYHLRYKLSTQYCCLFSLWISSSTIYKKRTTQMSQLLGREIRDHRHHFRMISSLMPCLATIFSNIDRKILEENQLLGNNHTRKHGMNIVKILSSHLSCCFAEWSRPRTTSPTKKCTNQKRKAQHPNNCNTNNKETTDTIIASVSWSCHVIEAWNDVLNPMPSERRPLVESLLKWIHCLVVDSRCVRETKSHVSLGNSRSSFTVDAPLLNMVLGCYMTLCGEVVSESDSEKRLIEQALLCLQSSS